MEFDYVAAAEEILRYFKAQYPDFEILLMDEDSPYTIGAALEERVPPELMEHFMESEIGMGILIGMIKIFDTAEHCTLEGVNDYGEETEEAEGETEEESLADGQGSNKTVH